MKVRCSTETPEILLGDVFGLYLEKGWHYLDYPNAIFIVEVKDATFEDVLESLNHEILHYVISKMFDGEESFKINYGLDYIIFCKRKFSPDLCEVLE